MGNPGSWLLVAVIFSLGIAVNGVRAPTAARVDTYESKRFLTIQPPKDKADIGAFIVKIPATGLFKRVPFYPVYSTNAVVNLGELPAGESFAIEVRSVSSSGAWSTPMVLQYTGTPVPVPGMATVRVELASKMAATLAITRPENLKGENVTDLFYRLTFPSDEEREALEVPAEEELEETFVWLKDLEAGRVYEIKTVAVNDNGFGPDERYIIDYEHTGGVSSPSPPKAVRVVCQSYDDCSLEITPPDNNQYAGSSRITGYYVSMPEFGYVRYSPVGDSEGMLTVSIEPPIGSWSYKVEVKSVNKVGESRKGHFEVKWHW